MTAPSETTDRVHAALDNFQPIGNATFRRVLLFLPWLMLAIAALNLLLWPVIAARFMWSTGMTAAALAVFAFIGLMQRIPQTFRALWNRNTIHACPPAPADEPPVAQYCAFVETTQRWMNDRRQFLFAALLSLIAVGWNVVAYSQIGGLAYLLRNADELLDVGVEVVVGFIIGLLTWRMVLVGWRVWQLGKEFDLTPQLGHPDQAGGLEPLGDLCLWNALIASIGGIFLGAWLIFGAGMPPSFKALAEFYRPTFSVLLAVPIAVSLISFFLPLWSVHQLMLAKRAAVQNQLDQLSRNIDQAAWDLLNRVDELDPAESEKLAKKLERMRQAYQEFRRIPTWPLNTRVLAKFATTQTIPVLGLTGLGQPLIKALAALIEFLAQGQ